MIALPVRLSEEDIGVILDAEGRDVCVVDSNSTRPDEEVLSIAAWIAAALNTHGSA